MSRPVRLEDLADEPDGRRYSPSAGRNRDDILPVLRRVLPERGLVLEVAAGTGEHAVHFAPELPGVAWQPAERDAEALASIRAWRRHAPSPNLREPIRLDLEEEPWGVDRADAIVAINLLHIAPWSTTEALLAGAGRTLTIPGVLFVYGAFFRDDHPTAPSNVEFDARLRAEDPALGVRRLEDVVAAAAVQGLALDAVIEMPNNNFGVVLLRG